MLGQVNPLAVTTAAGVLGFAVCKSAQEQTASQKALLSGNVAQKLMAHLGSIEFSMLDITTAASRMGDSILAIGRQSMPESQLCAA